MKRDSIRHEIEMAIRMEQTADDENEISLLQERLYLYRELEKDHSLAPLIENFTEKEFSDAIKEIKKSGMLYSVHSDYLPISVFCYEESLSDAVSFFIEKSFDWDEFTRRLQEFFGRKNIHHYRCERIAESKQNGNVKKYSEVKPTGEVLDMKVPFGLKYFHFLTAFGLFLAAAFNFLYALYLFGYENTYNVTLPDNVKAANILYGICMIGMAIYIVITRNRLAAFKKNAVRMFLIGIGLFALLDVLYASLVSYGGVADSAKIWSACAGTGIRHAVAFVINFVYFRKRKIIFTK